LKKIWWFVGSSFVACSYLDDAPSGFDHFLVAFVGEVDGFDVGCGCKPPPAKPPRSVHVKRSQERIHRPLSFSRHPLMPALG
jgi:hypothetical protein